MKYLITAFILLVLSFGGWYACNREKGANETLYPSQPEAARLRVIVPDTSGYAKYRAEAVLWRTRYKALEATNAAAKGKDKAQKEKAHHSADTFAKTPTLDNCREALADCQGENETKAFSLAVQERMLAELESRHKNDSAEIIRNRGTVSALSSGWKAANKALSKEQNGLKVYATAAFEKHPINNNIKVGGTVTFKRWLLAYDKGVIQNTHEIKGGILINRK